MNYQETSREAWRRFVPVSAELDCAIMRTITHFGPVICQEIETLIAREHQAVSGNLRHLVERGLVEASGQYGTTRSGRRAIKWQLTSFARGETALLLKPQQGQMSLL